MHVGVSVGATISCLPVCADFNALGVLEVTSGILLALHWGFLVPHSVTLAFSDVVFLVAKTQGTS